MSIDIIPINGKSQYIDYDKFESTLKEKIGRRCSDAKVFLLNNFPVSVSVETKYKHINISKWPWSIIHFIVNNFKIVFAVMKLWLFYQIRPWVTGLKD